MNQYTRHFEALGVRWSAPTRPDLPFQPAVSAGGAVYVSGQIPEDSRGIVLQGKVGQEIGLAAAQRAAGLCAANIVHWLSCTLDHDLDRVIRIAKVTVYVNAAADFTQYSQVGNGASEIFRSLFGERGEHARTAIGVAGLPANVPVEVDAVVHVR